MKDSSKLDLASEEIRRIGAESVEFVAEYYEKLRDRRIFPETSARDIRERLDKTLPENGEDFSQLLKVFEETIVALSRHNGHPRFFGYVASPGTAVTAFADLLASTLNSNLTSWRSAPAPVEIELLAINWIKQILGYDERAAGVFTSGGSMANFAALAAALQAKSGINVMDEGVQALNKKLRLYVSDEAHYSLVKAAALLGIGKANVVIVRTDEEFKIDLDDLVEKIETDLAAGHQPFCVAASAGTVSTGAFDSLAGVAEIAKKYDLWFHVDGSYGGFAALAPSVKPLFKGIERADSVSLDPHKWLFLPVDCGCVLYREPETARAAFSHTADYIRVVEKDDEAFAFWDYTPELSRRFRALKVWMMFRHVGTRKLSEAVEQNNRCAQYLEKRVKESADFEMMAPVELSIFCFRFVPPEMRAALENADAETAAKINAELDALNEQIMIALQHDGSSYLSNASVKGRFALRGCIINYRTTEKDMDVLLADVRRIAAKVRELK